MLKEAAIEAPAKQPLDSAPVALDEIVVTESIRKADARGVSTAISTVTVAQVKRSSIASFDEMARLIPNVSFNTDFNSLYLRGIGTAELNILSEQAIAYVLDGVYVPRIDYLKPGFMDVGRVDVHKGAQAAPFGRNAPAGLISVTYEEPTEHWASHASFSGGSLHLRKAEAAVSGPLTEKLSFRVAGGMHREDGHTLNLASGTRIGDRDIRQVRAKCRYQPTDALTASLGVSYFDYLIGMWAGSEIFEYPGALRAVIGLLDPTFETELDRRGSASWPNSSAGEGVIVPLRFDLDYRDHTLTSITGYSRLDDFQGGDIDGSAVPLAELLADTTSDTWSQEFRVVSLPGTTEYAGGLFLYQSRFDTDINYRIAADPGLGTVLGVALLRPFSPLLESGVLDVLPGMLFPGGAADTLNARMSVDIRALSVFGEVTRYLTEALAVSVGGRYSRDLREGTSVVDPQGPLPIWTILALGGYSTVRKAADENFSPKISLIFASDETTQLYASFAKGFRGGSYNVGAFSASDFEFKPERSTIWEAGIRMVLWDRLARLDVVGFWMTYADYQISAFNGFGYIVANAEEARSRGIESKLTAMVYPGLIVNTAVGYNATEFVRHTHGGCPTLALESPGGLPPQGIGALTPRRTCDLSGQPLFRAPQWTGNLGVYYDTPPSRGPFIFFVGANASYKGFEYMDADLDPVDAQDGYWLYSAHLGIKAVDGRWSFAVHGKNLSDTLVKTFSGDVPLQAGAHWALTNPPRTYSAMLRVNF